MMKQEIDLQQRSILYENYVARQVFGVRGVFASAPVDFFFYYTYSFFFFFNVSILTRILSRIEYKCIGFESMNYF